MQTFKSISLFSLIVCVRFLLGVVVGYFWYIAVALIFYIATSNLTDDWELIDHCRERMDGDLREFYDIGWELGNGELESERGYGVMAERVIVVTRIGRIGGLWIFPALGLIWGFSQKIPNLRGMPREMEE